MVKKADQSKKSTKKVTKEERLEAEANIFNVYINKVRERRVANNFKFPSMEIQE